MKMKLTDRVLRSNEIKLRDRPYDISDTHRDSPPSFGVRVMPNGEMTFHLYRRFPGSPSPVRRALGRFGEINLEDAREKGREWIRQIKEGVDPGRVSTAEQFQATGAERFPATVVGTEA